MNENFKTQCYQLRVEINEKQKRLKQIFSGPIKEACYRDRAKIWHIKGALNEIESFSEKMQLLVNSVEEHHPEWVLEVFYRFAEEAIQWAIEVIKNPNIKNRNGLRNLINDLPKEMRTKTLGDILLGLLMCLATVLGYFVDGMMWVGTFGQVDMLNNGFGKMASSSARGFFVSPVNPVIHQYEKVCREIRSLDQNAFQNLATWEPKPEPKQMFKLI